MPRKFLDTTGLAYVFSKIKTQIADSVVCKRASRLTVGTSAAGWTLKDCDYLCDGTSDNVEINAAISALLSTGGEVVLLDGAYNLSAPIAISKSNVTLSGNGAGTKLVRAFTGTSGNNALIKVTGEYCAVRKLSIDGVKDTYTSTSNHYGINLYGNNNTAEDCVVTNCASYGIYTPKSYNIIRGNHSTNNLYGIYIGGDHNTATGNVCNSNSSYGFSIVFGDFNVVSENIARLNGTRNISIYSSNYNVVKDNNCSVVSGDSVTPSEYAIMVQDSSSTYNIVVDNLVGTGAVENNGTGSVLATSGPYYTYGTTDLTAGSSALETGKLYFVYE